MGDWINRNLPCQECGSSDAMQESSHHFKCFSCGKTFLKRNNKNPPGVTPIVNNRITDLLDVTQYYDLTKRKITKKTCEKFNITCTKYTGSFGHGEKLHYVTDKWVYVFNHYYNGLLTKQKIRSHENKKDQRILGDSSFKEMFGQSIFPPKSDRIMVIVEGEFDAAVVWQETGFNCVSVTSGASSLLSDIKNNIDYLSKFQYVIIGMDNDDPGNEALKKVLEEDNLFEPGKLRIAKWPLKDPNELLLADRGLDIKKALWDAEEYKPKDLFHSNELIDMALIKPKVGVSTPWKDLTDAIMGWRNNTIITFAGADGIGKTEIVDEIIHELVKKGHYVWLYSCEQEPEETLRRQAGKVLDLPLHIPGTPWDIDKMRQSMESLGDKIILWRPEVITGVESLINRMRHVVISKGVRFFILDHLKAIESQMVDKNHGMGKFLSDLKSFVKTHNACIILLSHVAKDKKQGKVGKDDESWNRGRVPTKENIYGSSAIAAWSDVIIGLSRNVESDNAYEACITRMDILKNRLMGNRGQKRIYIQYIEDTGRLLQVNSIDYEANTSDEGD